MRVLFVGLVLLSCSSATPTTSSGDADGGAVKCSGTGSSSPCTCGKITGTAECLASGYLGQCSAAPAAGGSCGFNDLVIFTTKATFAGDLGGITGGDKKCQTFAAAAGLSGTFQAWLSDAQTNAIDRVPSNAGPWRKLVDGQQAGIVFTDKVNWQGFPKLGGENDEYGRPATSALSGTWTGTHAGGTKSGADCAGWTVSAGELATIGRSGDDLNPADQGWTQFADTEPCSAEVGLICYQVR